MHGRLAEIIVLDQFSRNLFRNSPLAWVQEAVRQHGFAEVTESERHFMLMPLVHSESRAVHEQEVPLFERYTTPYALDFELKHKAIIGRFGRYPHRNAVFGRETTAEERRFCCSRVRLFER